MTQKSRSSSPGWRDDGGHYFTIGLHKSWADEIWINATLGAIQPMPKSHLSHIFCRVTTKRQPKQTGPRVVIPQPSTTPPMKRTTLSEMLSRSALLIALSIPSILPAVAINWTGASGSDTN